MLQKCQANNGGQNHKVSCVPVYPSNRFAKAKREDNINDDPVNKKIHHLFIYQFLS